MPTNSTLSRIKPYALWIVQGFLALAFLSAGVIKLTMSDADLAADYPMPALFMRFIAVCEILGAVGLILPAVTRIRPGLTPLAAAGLVVIMTGATVLTAMDGSAWAIDPFVLGLLAAFVVYGRWSWLKELFGARTPSPSRTSQAMKSATFPR